MYDTVIFDLDGTLMDTLDDLTDSVNYVLAKYGYPVKSRQEVRRIVGNGLRQTLKLSLPQGADEETIDRLLPDLVSYYGTHCRIKTKPYEGIMDCLKELSAKGNIRCCLRCFGRSCLKFRQFSC